MTQTKENKIIQLFYNTAEKERKAGKRHTSLILLGAKTMENLIHKYYMCFLLVHGLTYSQLFSDGDTNSTELQDTTATTALSTAHCFYLPGVTRDPFTDFPPLFFLNQKQHPGFENITFILIKFSTSAYLDMVCKVRLLLYYLSFYDHFSLPEGLQW